MSNLKGYLAVFGKVFDLNRFEGFAVVEDIPDSDHPDGMIAGTVEVEVGPLRNDESFLAVPVGQDILTRLGVVSQAPGEGCFSAEGLGSLEVLVGASSRRHDQKHKGRVPHNNMTAIGPEPCK